MTCVCVIDALWSTLLGPGWRRLRAYSARLPKDAKFPESQRARAYHRCQARFLKQALMHDDFPNPNEHLSRASP
jgi:hypothetical protein